MSSLRLSYFDKDTPPCLVKKHIENLFDEICYLTHHYNLPEITNDDDEY